MRRTILNVTQSPMNSHRWLITFSCGHSQWITRRAKPRAQTGNCNWCDNKTTYRDERNKIG